ncbi:uncharacterized protein LOC103699848 [Phoenix dactylifera]|uniref:Uncharacterized protein LOC103699848 n=1 Tax=Phoenix dactylifera TaxID=42345 RepID=A0A8B8ZDB5_PHODC|nr:uncharacterized protein LOC103699848 [Phoenix dactylifera]
MRDPWDAPEGLGRGPDGVFQFGSPTPALGEQLEAVPRGCEARGHPGLHLAESPAEPLTPREGVVGMPLGGATREGPTDSGVSGDCSMGIATVEGDHPAVVRLIRAAVMCDASGEIEQQGDLGRQLEIAPEAQGEVEPEADHADCPLSRDLFSLRDTIIWRWLDRLRRRLGRDWETYAVESQGLSGGLLVLWRRGVATIDVFHNCSQQVIMVVSEPNAGPWVLCGVYASTDYRVRRALWQEITNLAAQGIPTVLVGDFNCIQSASDKRGGAVFTDRVDRREFRDFMLRNGMVDLGFSEPRFTWCNNQSGSARVWERLDRALASPDWILRFPTCRVSYLPRIASDHCPLLISTSSGPCHHSPFCFEKVWLSYPQSWDIVRDAWRVPVRGDAMQRVSRKLELTKRRLRRWNREVVGDIFRRLEGVESAITELQRREDLGGGLPEDNMSDLRGLLANHHSLLRQHEIFWRQKSRVQWVSEGDRNTRFFHRTTVIRRQRSMIHSLRDESGHRVEGEPAVRQVLLEFFRARWTEDGGPDDSDLLPRVDVGIADDENTTLVRPMSAQEVQEAVWALAADKAPGPDGFPPFFFRRYWGIIRGAVVEAVQCFFTQAAMPEDWKATFITLIPKRQEAAEPGHFRPISLCTTLYKGACTSRELEAYVPAPGAGPISHLLFADDYLLLTRARASDARVLRRVLAGYCTTFGQRVNLMKSTIQFSPSTESRVRQEIRRILQIPEQEGTLVYLGVPISGRRLRVTECSGLVQRVESRLEGWRASSLSMMGRLTLVRSVLGSMPVYLMANTVVPKTTLLKIEHLLRSFLWGSHGGGHGVHLVAWEQVCLPISEGGLGVQSLLERREALIARHAVRFLLEPQGLWSRVMAAR